MKRSLRLLAHTLPAVCLIAMLPARVPAWGGQGHRISARIAVWRLIQLRDKQNDPQARKALERISEILNANATVPKFPKPRTIEVASVWPDLVRRKVDEYNFANNLHFVSIPLDPQQDQDRFVRQEQCRQGDENVPGALRHDCVIGALEHFREVLRGESSSSKKRIEALSFIVHFMGDLHQPLHTSEDTSFRNDTGFNGGIGDRGGNLRYIFYFNFPVFNSSNQNSCFQNPDTCTESFGNERDHRQLHATWDKYMILTEMEINEDRGTETAYFDDLIRSLPSDPASPIFAEMASGEIVAWGEEAHNLAEKNAYNLSGPKSKKSPADDKLHDFFFAGQTYQSSNIKIVDAQLKRAGIRLAAFLMGTF